MSFQEVDFYLEDISESAYNTTYIKNKRNIHANPRYHIRQNSTQEYYEYRMQKICQYKGALCCVVRSCSARLAVLFGETLVTEKVGIKILEKFSKNSRIE